MWDVRSAGVPFVAGALLVFGGVRGLFLLCLCCGPGAELHCPWFVLFLPVRALCGLCLSGPGVGKQRFHAIVRRSSSAAVSAEKQARARAASSRRGCRFRRSQDTQLHLQLYLCLLWHPLPRATVKPVRV